jgi:small ligand-binding sensory domain FIST
VKWASSVSTARGFDTALAEVVEAVRGELGGLAPDLLLTFVSPHHEEAYPHVGEALRRAFPNALLVGCSAHSVIGGGQEVEEAPGLALVAAQLPGVHLHPFHLAGEPLPAVAVPPASDFLLLADPFSVGAEGVVRFLDARFPGRIKLGGLASGASQPGRNVLYLGRGSAREGCVGVALEGELRMETIVAQGCRPIGQPMFVTRCQGNLLLELDGRPPMEILGELYAGADARERALFEGSLFLGLTMRPARSAYGRGDYLIRNLVGAGAESGALQVGAWLRERQVVQFHLRDARTADEDLRERLARCATDGPPAGAVLFSCLGRGRQLYGVAGHDVDALHEHLGDVPVGGFFCHGEIGPVEGRTFLHGYTSAFGLFHPAAARADEERLRAR